MKILFITPSIPNDLNRVRARNIITALHDLGHEVHLVSLYSRNSDLKDVEGVKHYAKDIELFKNGILSALIKSLLALPLPIPMEVAYCFNRKLYLYLKKIAKKDEYDFVFIKRTRMAPYYRLFEGQTVFLDYTDVMSENYARLAKEATGLKRIVAREEAFKYSLYEKSISKRGYKVVVCSDNEKKTIKKRQPNAHVSVLENGINLSNWGCPKEDFRHSKSRLNLSFFGVMSYEPNRLAVDAFIKTVLPKMPAGYQFNIFGPGGYKVDNTKNVNVHYQGFVADIASELKKNDIFVCPLTTGTGIKNKIIQAASVGMPVVTTKYGIEGIDPDLAGYLFEVNSLNDFPAAIMKILGIPPEQLKQKMKSQSAAFKSRYGIKRIVKHFIATSVPARKSKVLFISNEYKQSGNMTQRLNNIYLALTGVPQIEALIVNKPEEEETRGPRSTRRKIPGLIRKIIFLICCFPDENFLFIPWAVLKSLKVIRNNKITVIFTSYPSVSSILSGHIVSRLTGIKHIVDFREPWLNTPDWIMRYNKNFFIRLRLRVESMVERGIIRNASKVIMNHEQMAKKYAKTYGHEEKLLVITNGYPDAFRGFQWEKHGGNSLKMIYAGSFYLQHQPDDLFKVLSMLGKNYPGLSRNFSLNIYGLFDDKTLLLAKRLEGKIKINFSGSLPQSEILNKLLASDLSVVTFPNNEWTRHRIPAKIYELMALKMPIMVIAFKDSDLHVLCESYGIPFFEPDDTVGATEYVRKLASGELSVAPIKNYEYFLENYSYSHIIRQLKDVIIEEISNSTK